MVQIELCASFFLPSSSITTQPHESRIKLIDGPHQGNTAPSLSLSTFTLLTVVLLFLVIVSADSKQPTSLPEVSVSISLFDQQFITTFRSTAEALPKQLATKAAMKTAQTATGGVQKPHRFHTGTVALWESDVTTYHLEASLPEACS
ncbi:hypothetical protein K443DRAFT_7765 [Laccaria amethystina LaAM-08-1]|uniref:Uncharacterized protein n=1 Tax=Laccaria amethystina LaAM-08-1 TaxID=1095629 RepID=A0A0C9XWF5_9AGAR|nr:hypothetical protein K443DRAFT_7765 [Laccaria amethystina LaAM-08-1]